MSSRVLPKISSGSPVRAGVSPNAQESATMANLRQSGEPLKSNTSSLTYGSRAQASPIARAAKLFPWRGSAEMRTDCHISGTVTSWPRSSRPNGTGSQISVCWQRSSGVRPTGTASGSRSATHSTWRRTDSGSRRMNTCETCTSSPDAIFSRPSIASDRPLPYGRSTMTREPSPSRCMVDPKVTCWPGFSGSPSFAA